MPPEPPSDTLFLEARFVGGRFDAHAIPLEVLPDLAAYRALIADVAKRLFLAEHPERQRVPKGFLDSFSLALTEVRRGNSATAVARRVSTGEVPQAALGFGDYFDQARDLVESVIEAATAGRSLPPSFPPESAKWFNYFGKGLRPDEHIEMVIPGRPNVAHYGRDERKRIVLSMETTYEDRVDGVLVLDGGRASAGVFFLKDEQGQSIEAAASDQVVLRALAWTPRPVRVVGTGQFDRNDRLQRILELEDFGPAVERAARDLADQFRDLRALPSDWYEGASALPDAANLDKLERLLRAVRTMRADITAPFLYPLPEGGAVAEWTIDDWEVSLTVLNRSTSAELHALNVATDVERSALVDVADTDGGARIVVELLAAL